MFISKDKLRKIENDIYNLKYEKDRLKDRVKDLREDLKRKSDIIKLILKHLKMELKWIYSSPAHYELKKGGK